MISLAGAGAAFAWLGAALLVLNHGRRGLALGLLVATAGLGLVGYGSGRPQVAACLVAGGVLAAGLRLRDGDPGWGLIPSGSTPRLVLCLLALVAVALIGTTLQGSTPALVAALAVTALAAGRALTADRPSVALAAASALALGLGVAGTQALALTVAIAGAAVAVAIGLISAEPGSEPAS
jgi:hypothetical protein